MATEADIGHGSDFQRGDGAPTTEVFATVGEVTAINGFSITKDVVDVTHMKSPDRFEEIITSIKRTGEITVDVNFKPASQTTTDAIADVAADGLRNYKIVFPDATEWLFSAACVGFSFDLAVEDKMAGTFTYKPSGKPAFIEVA